MVKNELTGNLSIVIPCLNEAKVISGCLESLLNQVEKPLEVLIIDNGSTDKTYENAQKFKKRFQEQNVQFRVMRYSKGNQTDARNLGVRESKGSIIGSLDADSWAKKDWIQKIKMHLKDQNIIGIGGKSSFRNKGFILNFLYVINYYWRLPTRFYCLGGGNSAFRKSAFLKVNGFDGIEEFRKKENIKHAKDDFYLSKKLETIGQIKFCPDMNVTLLSRVRSSKTAKRASILNVFHRVYLETKYDWQIVRHFK